MLSKICLVLIIMSLLLLSSCNKTSNSSGNPLNPPGGGSTTAEFYPLKIGDSWTFAIATWTAAIDTNRDTVLINIQDTATVYNNIVGYKDNYNEWYVIANGELRFYQGPAQPTDTSQYAIWINEPLQVGDSWLILYPVQPDSYKYQIASTTASVTVPAGNFPNCLQINRIPTGEYNYYSSGVGQVKYVYDSANGHQETTLVNYVIH